MSTQDLDSVFESLEQSLTVKLRAAYLDRWQRTLAEHIQKTGPIDETRIDDITDYFLGEFLNFSAIVVMESVSKSYFKHGLVNEVSSKIDEIIDKAIQASEADAE